ncbi:MAG: hypothetical protein KY452_11325, partial [Actinobacteria bacterium]|nr:hypothetical protein [Actinomycetota bacterium]
MRLFVAVRPPPEVVATLATLDRPERPGLRWTPPEQWHVTLRFFGPVDAEQAEAEGDEAEAALDAAQDAQAVAADLLAQAASLGACDCDLAPEVEEAAAAGDVAASALVEACGAAEEEAADDEEEEPSSGLCGDIALSLDEVMDLTGSVEEVLSSCQDAVDAALGSSDLAFCDDPEAL